MAANMESKHRDRVLDQFSRQAVPFSKLCGRSHEEALDVLLRATAVTTSDSVLDVACGPGRVALAFAAVAKQVIGIDVVPAMIERARELQAETRLDNVRWLVGDASSLP